MNKGPGLLEYFYYDCLDGNKAYSFKKMFGGYGIYKYSKIFSIYVNDEIYFKVGENNKNYFLEYNSKQFSYIKNGKVIFMKYFLLPEEIMENREELEKFINSSLEVI